MARGNKVKIAIKMLGTRIEDAHVSLEKAVSNKDYNTAHIQEIRMNALLEALGIFKACIEEGGKTTS